MSGKFEPLDLIGQKFGRLIVLSREPNDKNWRTVWRCICECKNIKVVRGELLSNGHVQSCGCLHKRQGGIAKTREYKIWGKMIRRCTIPSDDNYKYYGGAGKYVCKRWMTSAAAFINDVGLAPSKGHTIDRINNDGSYTCGKCDECRERNQPANCRWATKDIQVRNTVRNLWFTHEGKTLILKDWARLKNVDYATTWQRIYKLGWSFEKAINTPVRRNRGRKADA